MTAVLADSSIGPWTLTASIVATVTAAVLGAFAAQWLANRYTVTREQRRDYLAAFDRAIDAFAKSQPLMDRVVESLDGPHEDSVARELQSHLEEIKFVNLSLLARTSPLDPVVKSLEEAAKETTSFARSAGWYRGRDREGAAAKFRNPEHRIGQMKRFQAAAAKHLDEALDAARQSPNFALPLGRRERRAVRAEEAKEAERRRQWANATNVKTVVRTAAHGQDDAVPPEEARPGLRRRLKRRRSSS